MASSSSSSSSSSGAIASTTTTTTTTTNNRAQKRPRKAYHAWKKKELEAVPVLERVRDEPEAGLSEAIASGFVPIRASVLNESYPSDVYVRGADCFLVWTERSRPPQNVAFQDNPKGDEWEVEGGTWEPVRSSTSNAQSRRLGRGGQSARQIRIDGTKWTILLVAESEDPDCKDLKMMFNNPPCDDDGEEEPAVSTDQLDTHQHPPNNPTIIEGDLVVRGKAFATLFTTTSDETKKHNIRFLCDEVPDLFARIRKIRGRAYELNDDDGSKTRFGFLAQEFREQFPQVVEQHPDDGHLAVDYPGVSTVMFEAIGELDARVSRIEAAISRFILHIHERLESLGGGDVSRATRSRDLATLLDILEGGVAGAEQRQRQVTESDLQQAAKLVAYINEQDAHGVTNIAQIGREAGWSEVWSWAEPGKFSLWWQRYKQWKRGEERSIRVDGRDPTNLLRGYQREMVDAILERPRRPVLLVMPTGSGKTDVAAHVLLALIPPTTSLPSQRGIALFIVRDCVLADQQQRRLRSASPVPEDDSNGWRVATVYGSTPPFINDVRWANAVNESNWNEVAEGSHVVVTTAGFAAKLNEAGALDWRKICAVVLDEVHNACGNSSGALLLRHINTLPASTRPFVLGMTATPGSGSTEETVERKIAELESLIGEGTRRLGVNASDPRLSAVLNIPEEEVVRVNEPPPGSWLRHIINVLHQACRVLRDDLQRVTREVLASEWENRLGPAPQESDDGDVSHSLVAWSERAGRVMKGYTKSNKLAVEAERVAWLLERIGEIALAAPDIGVRETRALLNRLAGEATYNQRTDVVNEVMKLLKQTNLTTNVYAMEEEEEEEEAEEVLPKLNALIEILREAARRNARFRAVVRVETRHTARFLVRTLTLVKENDDASGGAGSSSSSSPFIRPALLVGRGSRQGDVSFSTTEMRDNVESFREGRANVLVSTSVVQEGIDVKECDLVVCYNMGVLRRAIDLVQLAGRARARGGRFVALAVGGSDHSIFESTRRQVEIVERVTLSG